MLSPVTIYVWSYVNTIINLGNALKKNLGRVPLAIEGFQRWYEIFAQVQAYLGGLNMVEWGIPEKILRMEIVSTGPPS